MEGLQAKEPCDKPGELMIGEIWESSETWLQGDMFDSTMNYDFREKLQSLFWNRSHQCDRISTHV